MSKHRIIVAVALLVYVTIIFLPPIIHGYIYPNIGDDTAAHMNVFDQIGFFAPDAGSHTEKIRYGALYIVGYPLDLIRHVTNVDSDALFMWFNYLVLIGVGVSLFFIFKDLVGLSAGLLALIVPVFTSYGVLILFYSGVIFDIINIGIILPLACYYSIKWWISREMRLAIISICLFCLFAVFHSTGVYLPFIAVAGCMAFLGYKVIKRQTISRRSVVATVVGVLICLVLFVVFNPIIDNILYAIAISSKGLVGLPLLARTLGYYMSYFIFVIIVASITLLIGQYHRILTKEKSVLIVFGLLSLVMLPAVLFGWSPQPFRQGINLAIFLSLIAVALLGVIIRLGNYRMIVYLLVGLSIWGAFINVYNWFGYNSALEGVDIEAIHYINTLPGASYSCSDNVDPWIYSRFVDKEYLTSNGEILVIRNVPMRSKVKLVDDGDLIGDKKYMAMFVDGETEVIVYK